MARIPIRVEQFDDEPAWSVLRRLARLAGTPNVREFCLDFGLDLVAIENGYDLSGFADDGGYDLGLLTRNSIAFRRTHYEFAGERILNNGVPRGWNRVCLSCLHDDLQRPGDREAYNPHWRDWWFVHGIGACPFHQVLLTISPSKSKGRMESDILDPRHGLDLDVPETSVRSAAAEAYLLGRLGFMPAARHWLLDDLPFGKAITALRNFGTASRYGAQAEPVAEDDDDKSNAVMNAGFEVFASRKTLDGFLDDLFAGAEPPVGNWGPRVVYGGIYDWLKEEGKERMSGNLFDGLRRIVREHADRTFPVNPNEEFFAEKVGERNIFTVDHLWRMTGIHASRWRPILLREGLLDAAGAARPNWHIFVKAADAQALAAKLDGHMTSDELKSRYGIPRGTFLALLEAGCLVPWLQTGDIGEGHHIWLKQDVEDWFVRLRGGAPLIDTIPAGATSLVGAFRTSWTSVADIVNAMLDGRLRACGVLVDEKPWPALVLMKAEIKQRFDEREADGMLGMNEAIAALRSTHAMFIALVKGKHLPSRVMRGTTMKTKICVDPDDVAAFDREFVSMKEAAKHLGTHSRVLREHLASCDVHPAFDLGISPASAYYQRAEVEALPKGVFRSGRSKRQLRRK